MPSLATVLFAAAGLLPIQPAPAQMPSKPSPDLQFEVASLKPSPKDARPTGIRPAQGGERYEASAIPLRLFLMVAYRVKLDQIVGGPSWIDTDFFDMHAKAEKPSTVEELHIMLRNLLAERFHLKLHSETREMAMYALVVDKGGPKLQPHEAKSAGDPWIDQAQNNLLHLSFTATFCNMEYFAYRLGQAVDLPVVDKTNLTGDYDFKLYYTRDLPPGMAPDSHLNGEPIDTTGPSLFEALKEQLGLRLDKQRGPVDTLVIDHIEKLSEN